MAKRADFKAKQKRQKIIAAGSGVILLGLLAIQGPKTWALLNQKAPPEPVPVATGTPAPGSQVPLAPPTTAGAAPAASGGDGVLVDSDPPPLPTQNQLLSFNRFVTKDPFVEQIDTSGGVPVAEPTPSKKPAAKRPTGDSPLAPAPAGSPQPDRTAPSNTGGSQTAATSATISVNGIAEKVSTGKDFPSAQPIFRLVSLTAKTAKIAIAGGSFASGKPTITLQLGKTITLMNTADGTRYELRLVSVP